MDGKQKAFTLPLSLPPYVCDVCAAGLWIDMNEVSNFCNDNGGGQVFLPSELHSQTHSALSTLFKLHNPTHNRFSLSLSLSLVNPNCSIVMVPHDRSVSTLPLTAVPPPGPHRQTAASPARPLIPPTSSTSLHTTSIMLGVSSR